MSPVFDINLDGLSTKDRIFHVAAELFSKKGYNAVSMRDIAELVGIKDSSIYNHYKAKDEILDYIFNYFKNQFLKSLPADDQLDKIMEYCSPERFLEEGFLLFKKRMDNPLMAKIYLIILTEQTNDNRAGQLWLEYQELPISFMEKAFEKMIAKGWIRPLNPKLLAIQYEFPIFVYINEYIKLKCGNKDTSEIENSISEHKKFFLELIGGNNGSGNATGERENR